MKADVLLGHLKRRHNSPDQDCVCDIDVQRQIGFAETNHVARALLLKHHATAGDKSINGERTAPGRVLAVQTHHFTRLAFVKLRQRDGIAPRDQQFRPVQQPRQPVNRSGPLEAVRTQIEEPVYVRDTKYANSI